MNLKMLSRYLCGILQDTMCCVGVSCQASKPYTHPYDTFAITHIQDAYGAHCDFGWDANGNLVNSHAYATHTDRSLCWTEDVAAQSERRASLLAFPSQSSVGAAKRLELEKLRSKAFDTMIDEAEANFNIPIRKKTGTKQ